MLSSVSVPDGRPRTEPGRARVFPGARKEIIPVLLKLRLVLFSILFLGGCAAQQLITEADKLHDWRVHQSKLAGLNQWVLRGRIAIRVDKEGWTATLHWRQQQNSYSLRLIAPLGQGSYELTGNDRTVTLRTADNRVVYADNPEMLLQQNLGWQLPVSGRARDISQAGWRVTYSDYMISKGYELPEKLTMQHEKLRIRLVIQDWEFPLL